MLTDTLMLASASYPPMPNKAMGDDADCLNFFSPKDAPWDRHKAQSDRISKIYADETEFQRFAQRIFQCAGELGFAWVGPDDGAQELRLRSARFCRVRTCPICQWRRSMMWQARFYESLPVIQDQFPKHRWIFLTLTVRNCPITELRDTLKTMTAGWTRLIRLPEFRTVSGWIRTTEVTRGAEGTAHPHFHCLLLVKPSYFRGACYVSQSRWAEAWKAAARLDYQPVVDVRAVKGDLSKAVQETLKYAVKPSDMEGDSAWFLEYTRQVHKLRFLATGGGLKQILKAEEPESNQDLITVSSEVEPADEVVSSIVRFDWNRPRNRYKKSR